MVKAEVVFQILKSGGICESQEGMVEKEGNHEQREQKSVNNVS